MPDRPDSSPATLEQLHTDLQNHLKTSGHLRRDPTGKVRYGREDGLTSLLHTPFCGPVEVTDHASAVGHREFEPQQTETPDLNKVLYASSAILSIACGGELRKLASGEVKDGLWYLLGRREDIRPRSLHEVILNAAIRRAEQEGREVPPIAPTDVIAFNMEEIVLDAAKNDCLRGLSEGLGRLKQS